MLTGLHLKRPGSLEFESEWLGREYRQIVDDVDEFWTGLQREQLLSDYPGKIFCLEWLLHQLIGRHA